MAQDFLLDAPKGITALTPTLLGYAIGMARQYIVSPSPVLPVLLVAGGTSPASCSTGPCLPARPAERRMALLFAWRFSAVYNAILTPLVFPCCAGPPRGRVRVASPDGEGAVSA